MRELGAKVLNVKWELFLPWSFGKDHLHLKKMNRDEQKAGERIKPVRNQCFNGRDPGGS